MNSNKETCDKTISLHRLGCVHGIIKLVILKVIFNMHYLVQEILKKKKSQNRP